MRVVLVMIALLVLALPLRPADATVPGNILPNGGFEEGNGPIASGWSLGGAPATREDELSFSGEFALVLAGASTASAVKSIPATVDACAVDVGAAVLVEAGSVRVSFEFFDAAHNLVASTALTAAESPAASRASAFWVTPSRHIEISRAAASFDVVITSNGLHSATLVDEVFVKASGTCPVACFTSASTDALLSVDGSCSSDDGGSITRWVWAWGDGTTSLGRMANHTYGRYQTYTVSLQVTDDHGVGKGVSRVISISRTPPPPARYSRSWEGGLGDWQLTGSGISVDCSRGRTGSCSLRALPPTQAGDSFLTLDREFTLSNNSSVEFDFLGESEHGDDIFVVDLTIGGQHHVIHITGDYDWTPQWEQYYGAVCPGGGHCSNSADFDLHGWYYWHANEWVRAIAHIDQQSHCITLEWRDATDNDLGHSGGTCGIADGSLTRITIASQLQDPFYDDRDGNARHWIDNVIIR